MLLPMSALTERKAHGNLRAEQRRLTDHASSKLLELLIVSKAVAWEINGEQSLLMLKVLPKNAQKDKSKLERMLGDRFKKLCCH